jgi:hypothetical protein
MKNNKLILCTLVTLLLMPLAALSESEKPMTKEEEEAYVKEVNQHLQKNADAHKAYNDSVKSRTVWSDKKDCRDQSAILFQVVTFEHAWNISICGAGGCRVAVKDYPGNQPYEFKKDNRIIWESPSSIRLRINGESKLLYNCEM